MKKIKEIFIGVGALATIFVAKVAHAACFINGREVPCEELKSFGAIGVAVFLFLVLFLIVTTVFWVMMIIHAAKHEVPNKVVWILVMVFTGFIGAIIYYFAVKRSFVPSVQPTSAPANNPPTPPSEHVA